MKHCVYLQSTQIAHGLLVSVKGCYQVPILSSFVFPCRQLKRDNPTAVVLSTDDFFIENGVYVFEPDFLEDAHKWNQKRGDWTLSRAVQNSFAFQAVFKLSLQIKIPQGGVIHCSSWSIG